MRRPPIIRTKRQQLAHWLDIVCWTLYGGAIASLILSVAPTSNFTAIIVGHVLLYVSFAVYLLATWAAQRSLAVVGFLAFLVIWGLLILTGPLVASAIAASSRR